MSNDVEVPKNANDLSDVQSTSPGTLLSWYAAFLHQTSIYGIAAGYCVSASLLSIINKWAVMKFPYPGALTALQYFTSAFGVVLCGWLKFLEHDKLDLLTMWRFLPAAVLFYLSLFANSELLLHANVDTFIVFRSAVPIFVAIGETLFLHQPWPALKTWFSLSTIFAGSVLYVITDYHFTLTAYSWALAYLLLIMGELKKIEHDISDDTDWYSFQVILPVGLSCLFGLAISFFGFSCRRAISATGFTVLGIVNKLLTVVINLVVWDKYSTLVGTVGLLICMGGGVLYQQSTSNKPKPPKAEEVDEEQQKLLELQSVSENGGCEKIQRRLAQNREAARKSRLRKKAYVQQLETSRLKLAQLELELERARKQGMLISGANANMGLCGTVNSGIAAFEMEYAHWIDEQERKISDLKNVLQTPIGDMELRLMVENFLSHYCDLFRMKKDAARADAFYLVSGMWRTSVERFLLWIGGFKPSELINVVMPQLQPLTEQQNANVDTLKHSCMQAEDALSQGMEKLQQTLAQSVTFLAVGAGNYSSQAALAFENFESLEGFINQADHLREQILRHMSRILTTRQAAKGLVAFGEYFQRLRGISALWSARCPREPA